MALEGSNINAREEKKHIVFCRNGCDHKNDFSCCFYGWISKCYEFMS